MKLLYIESKEVSETESVDRSFADFNMKSEISIKVGGPAGAGVKSVGQILAKTLQRSGFQVFEYPEYPSLIRGGHNTELVQASLGEKYSLTKPVDLLIALDDKTLKLDLPEVVSGGMVIFDSKIEFKPSPSKIIYLSIPLSDIAQKLGNPLMANVVAVGAGLKVMGLSTLMTSKLLTDQFFKKGPDVVAANIKALEAGWNFVKEKGFKPILDSVDVKPSNNLMMTGNEALSLGAISAGLGLYAAYPMTPSTPILHYLSAHQQEFGYVVRQAEDEISAVNMIIGAMHMGVRAMCGTSGGGFALMNESLALAGMTETPLVVVLVQRPGPATGLPTWTEQGELQYAIHAAHGEFLKFVLAPGDNREIFQMAFEAFNLAERYQTPAIIMLDKFLSESSMTCGNLFPDKFTIDRGKISDPLKLKRTQNYQRYQLTDDGISERSLPGMEGGVFCANSDEHEYHGLVDESSSMRIWQVDKRLKKMDAAAKMMPGPKFIGPKNAKITIVAWGSGKLAGIETMEMINNEQKTKNNEQRVKNRVNVLHFSYLWPMNVKAVSEALKNCAPSTLLIEQNATGQFQALLKEQIGWEPTAHLRKYDGRPFYAEEIIGKIDKLVNGLMDS
ncbi:2-oxoacid:acceptor oxidoreductase subunit alpha [Candidatus Collierbacteria bacterium]|nr:2-oxoacid:acceptor oxidoreductase subunit alpha [Candidatus Collierbacteria bacterium]